MICNECHKQLDECPCPDIDNRMKELAMNEHNSLLWAICCDKHYQRCKCELKHFQLSNEILKEKSNV